MVVGGESVWRTIEPEGRYEMPDCGIEEGQPGNRMIEGREKELPMKTNDRRSFLNSECSDLQFLIHHENIE